ncbi:MAG: LPS-assembly protein LptD [Nitrospirae bacterium]|nr:LPS-assembly protein LptD [Nitrospirota bacterium]
MFLLAMAIDIAFATSVFGEVKQTKIDAKNLQYDSKSHVYYLDGDVTIIKGKAILTADYVEYHEDTSVALAKGNVVYTDEDVIIHAMSADINTAVKTGVLTDATMFFKKDNYHVKGEKLIKKSDKEYTAEKATFTTCDAPVPEWCFYAAETDVILDDVVRSKGVIAKIEDFPVLYTPYFFSALKRQTGFLMPVFGYKGDKGTYVNVPFYWVLSDNRDMTIVLDEYSRRGIGQGVEYRYVESGGIQGRWWVYHFGDNSSGKDYLQVKGWHTQFMDNGFSTNFNVDYLNKDDFYRQYSLDIQSTLSRFLESTGELAYSTDKSRTYLLSQYSVDLQYSTSLISQKLPELGFVLHPVSLGPIDKFALNASLTNFSSQNGIRAERYYLSPAIYHTIGDGVTLTQSLGGRLDLYNLNGASLVGKKNVTDDALLYTSSVDTTLRKDYGGFTHVVEPSLQYGYVSGGNTAPTLDSIENFNRQSQVQLSVMNYFMNDGGTFLYARFLSPYDTGGDRQPAAGPLKLQVRLEKPLDIKAEATYGYYGDNLKTVNSEMLFKIKDVDVTVGERYDNDKNILFFTGTVGFNILSNLRLNSAAWYDAKGPGLNNLGMDLIYTKQCWGLEVLYRKTNGTYSVYFMLDLKGLGKYKFLGV